MANGSKATAKSHVVRRLEIIMEGKGDFDRSADRWKLEKRTPLSDDPIEISVGVDEMSPFCELYFSIMEKIPLDFDNKEDNEKYLQKLYKIANASNADTENEWCITSIDKQENVAWLNVWCATHLTDSMTEEEVFKIYDYLFRATMSCALKAVNNAVYAKSLLA